MLSEIKKLKMLKTSFGTIEIYLNTYPEDQQYDKILFFRECLLQSEMINAWWYNEETFDTTTSYYRGLKQELNNDKNTYYMNKLIYDLNELNLLVYDLENKDLHKYIKNLYII